MGLKTTLAEVGRMPGTAKDIALRLNRKECETAVELLTLFHRGQVTRIKVAHPKGRRQYQYSIADEAGSQL